jgi:hypothetical protein
MHLSDFDTRLEENTWTLLLKDELKESTPAFGIAIQVLRQGLRSLAWKQRFVYLGEMTPLLRRHELTSEQRVGLDYSDARLGRLLDSTRGILRLALPKRHCAS